MTPIVTFASVFYYNRHLYLHLLLFSITILFLVLFANLPILQQCFEIWQWEALGTGRRLLSPMRNVFRLSYAQSCWGKKFPLGFCQQRQLKTGCWGPSLPRACCPPSPGSSFQHGQREVGLRTGPSSVGATRPAGPEANPTVGGHMSPFGHLWWLLLAWRECAAPGSFSSQRLHEQKVIPQGHRCPHASGSVRPTAGLADPPGLALWRKAHLTHYLQLRHLSPVAGLQETAVQCCY